MLTNETIRKLMENRTSRKKISEKAVDAMASYVEEYVKNVTEKRINISEKNSKKNINQAKIVIIVNNQSIRTYEHKRHHTKNNRMISPKYYVFKYNFFVIPFSSLVGALTQRKNIGKEIVLYAIIGGVIGEIIGAYFVGFIPTLVLAIIFVTLCIIIEFMINSKSIVPKITQKIKPNKKNILGSSFFVSFITGLRGGTGGKIFPALFKSLGMNTHKAIATSLTVSIFTAFGAIPIYYQRGNIIWLPALFVLI